MSRGIASRIGLRGRGALQASLGLAAALTVGPGCLVSFDESLIGGDRGATGDSTVLSGEASATSDGRPADAGPGAEQPPPAADGPPPVVDASPPVPDGPPPHDTAPSPPDTAPPRPDTAPPPPDSSCTPTLRKFAFPVRADATVDELEPATNFGYETALYVDQAPDLHAYLRFRVYGLTGAVQSVVLELHVTDSSADGPAVHATANGWPEADITWDTRPAPNGPPLADLGTVGTGPLQIPLPGALSGDGTYSFVLVPTSDDGLDFDSKEGADAPRLVVTVAEGC